MIKPIVAALLSLIVSFNAYPQQLNVTNKDYRDSLKEELFLAEQDTSIVQVLNSLAESYWTSKYDSGIFYAKNSLLIARKANYKLGEFHSLITLSLASAVIGDMVRGYQYSSMAINLAKELTNQKLLSKAYAAYGEVLSSTGKYQEAILAINTAISTDKEDERQLLNNYAQLSDWYEKLNQSDSSTYYGMKASQTMDAIGLMTPYPLRIVGNMHRKEGEKVKALNYYKQSIQSAINFRDDVSMTQAYLDMAKLYQEMQFDSAIYYANQALKSAEKSRSPIYIIKSSNYLSDLYAAIDQARALKYAMKSNEAKDSLKYIIQEQAIRSFEDFDLKLREIEIEQAQNELNAKIRQNTFIGSSIILLIIVIALYLNNRVKKRGKRKVELAYQKLKNAQQRLIHSEKMASLGEITAGIAHEIQNPLNFVNNFSELNRELFDEVIEAAAANDKEELAELIHDIKNNEQKISYHGKRAAEIVNSMLHHSKPRNTEKETTDLNTLADECLSLTYHGIRAKDNEFKAAFQLISDPDLPMIDVVRHDISRVLLNLISNAFYAVTEKAKEIENGYTPTVEVITEKTATGIAVKVKDNGKGIPDSVMEKIFQPFFTTKPTGVGTGLGLSMSYDIVTKGHGGTIEVESQPDKGSKFIINLHH